MVHEQKFKDLLSSTYQVSVERSMLDLESEVQWFNTHWGNIMFLEIFCFHIVTPLMPILALLPFSFNYEKPRIRGFYSGNIYNEEHTGLSGHWLAIM